MTTAAPLRDPSMPPWWLGVALVAWGIFAESLAGGIVMAGLLEAVRRAPIKWAMADREFHRAADLASILFALATVIQFQRYAFHGIYEILRVVPYCLFPLVLVQFASTRQSVPMSALFYSLRRQPEADRPIDLAPFYLGACILASSPTLLHGPWYLLAVVTLVLGAIVRARPLRFDRWQWVGSLVIAAAIGAATLAALHVTQRALEASFEYWFHQFPWSMQDFDREVTSIGAIGRLKLSDQIRVRVAPHPALELPLLLEEAHYDTFRYGTWATTDAPFAALDQAAGQQRWVLDATSDPASASARNSATFEITVQHRRELTLLPLPAGALAIDSAEIAEVQRNRLGAVMAESPPGALRFQVTADATGTAATAPVAADRRVPTEYAELIDTTLAEIGVTRSDAVTDAARIQRFFLENFTYTLVQRRSLGARTPLAKFLTDDRRGHCEHFATATVLLLRAAGIPARYSVGYVVEDYSAIERRYIARARHAHAWASAYVEGRWVTVDSTPGVWFDLEENAASPWQGVQDTLAWAWFRFQRLSQADFTAWGDGLLWFVPPLALLLYLRLRRSPTAVRARTSTVAESRPGPPAAIEPVLAALAARGLLPLPGETVRHFITRAAPADDQDASARALVDTYYRVRFGAPPPSAPEVRRLEERIAHYASGIRSGERFAK